MTVIGRQPRLQRPLEWVAPLYGTPRDLSRATYGAQVGDVCRRLTQEPMPHQQHIWDVGLEVDADGRFAYDAVVILIMRQEGKTTMVFAKCVWRLTVAPKLLRPNGRPWGRQRALYQAQLGKVARRKLERDFIPQLREGRPHFREVPNAKARGVRASEWRKSLNNGQECIEFGQGNFFQIDATTDESGHSDILDDVNLDEARFIKNDSLEAGVEPTMATRWNPQIYTFSTAGDDESYFLYSKVLAGRAHSCRCGVQFMDECSCGFAGNATRTAYFEYALPAGCNIDDQRVWWRHMPALGRTKSPEFVASVLARRRENPQQEGGEETWRQEYGNQWVKIPMLGGETRLAKLPPDAWADSVLDDDEAPPAMRPGAVRFGFDVSPGGEWASIAVAGGDQQWPYVELVDRGHAEGVGWLQARLVELARRWKPGEAGIGFDQSGPVGSLAESLRSAFVKARLDPKILKPLSTVEYRAACGLFYLDVKEGRLTRAPGQEPLDLAGDDATERRLGDAWVWDRRTAGVPITPLVAATCARLLLAAPAKKRKWTGAA